MNTDPREKNATGDHLIGRALQIAFISLFLNIIINILSRYTIDVQRTMHATIQRLNLIILKFKTLHTRTTMIIGWFYFIFILFLLFLKQH